MYLISKFRSKNEFHLRESILSWLYF